MGAKYAALTQYLQAAPADEDVVLDLTMLGHMVGGLPPSSTSPGWWSNSSGHTQAQAWLMTGRTVRREADRVVFSPVGVAAGSKAASKSTMILDGVAALAAVLRRAGYPSIVAAVTEHTIFLDPRTVAQTKGQAVFPVIRDMTRRGQDSTLPDGRAVLLDDNTTPTLTFRWAAMRAKGRDVQYNHVWTDAKNPDLYTALWNLCATPAFLAKTTDGKNHPEVRAALQYRAYELYGAHPPGQPPPRPPDFDGLRWAPMPDPVPDLEATVRAQLMAAGKSPPARAARTIGWLFSDGRPDPSIGVSGSTSTDE